ncbi:hypothetical protein GF324_01730, partial [bacterium]|nr:hypothetical protein [bacterium]
MRRFYLAFLRGVSANRVSLTGTVMVTASVMLFLAFEIMHIIGLFSNAYVGMITYLLLPLAFIVGLVLVPLGWWLKVRKT